jgi:hypothetical protein
VNECIDLLLDENLIAYDGQMRLKICSWCATKE